MEVNGTVIDIFTREQLLTKYGLQPRGGYDRYSVPLVFNSPLANVCDWNFIVDSELIFLEELCWNVEGVTPASLMDLILHRLMTLMTKREEYSGK